MNPLDSHSVIVIVLHDICRWIINNKLINNCIDIEWNLPFQAFQPCNNGETLFEHYDLILFHYDIILHGSTIIDMKVAETCLLYH
jgi:hypothetical protein